MTTLPGQWLENDDRWIPAHHQPALLLELAIQRGLSPDRVLAGTGIFHEELLSGRLLISPSQFARLIQNLDRLFPGEGLSFLFGHQLYPGHYGAFSTLMQQSDTLLDALTVLRQFHLILCPLIYPRITTSGKECFVRWWPVCGLERDVYLFCLEAMSTALISLSRQWADHRATLRFEFRHRKPFSHEQYRVNLGEKVRFGGAMDLITLPREWLYFRHPASETSRIAARNECLRAIQHLPDQGGFIEQVKTCLAARTRNPPSLKEAAERFDMSRATFKRKLSKHHLSYQQLVDEVRRDMAIFLFRVRGLSSQQVAEQLNYSDLSNFRRSFKRWTGLTPAQL
jgi:AraC-like DNA-binding protein